MKTYRLSDFTKDGFPLSVIRQPMHADIQMHAHDFQELAFVVGGDCMHSCGATSYRISAGDVFVIAGNESHSYHNARNLYIFTIIFDLSKLGLPLQDLRSLPGFLSLFELEPKLRNAHKFKSRLKLQPSELGEIEAVANSILNELKTRDPGYKALCAGYFLELLTKLSRMNTESPNAERKELWNISLALRSIETQYAKTHSLESLSKEAGMSKRNFQRLFKEAVGESPISHLLNVRLKKASEELIESPKESVSEIAVKTGFYDGNYFARQFVRRFKMSPTDFRRT